MVNPIILYAKIYCKNCDFNYKCYDCSFEYLTRPNYDKGNTFDKEHILRRTECKLSKLIIKLHKDEIVLEEL